MRQVVSALAVVGVLLSSARGGDAQPLLPASSDSGSPMPDAPGVGSGPPAGSDISLDGRVGAPTGAVRVGETPVRGAQLRLHSDLGIDVSEAVEASLGYHFTPRDAVRFSYLQYFLEGSSTINRPVIYNGPVYGPGRFDSSLDFYRLSLDYERALFMLANGGRLTGSAGLTYVQLDAVAHSNHEDFYRQELPVPILGIRLTEPLSPRWGFVAGVAGGGLPRVDSLRQEGGTVYLEQWHADAEVGVAYALTATLQATAGYHFMYFFQLEKSHEDNNRFELIDNGVQVGLRAPF
jgi:hypothetical protein